MKKRYLIILITVLLFVLVGCKRKQPTEETEIEKFINVINASEETLTAYNETDIILDGETEVYKKELSFKVQRGEVIKTEVHQVEQKLNPDIESNELLVKTEYDYVTIGDKKYDLTNDKEEAYVIPTYYLTFMLCEEDLDEGYNLNSTNNKIVLTSKIKGERIANFFLNKDNSGVQSLNVVIEVTDNKLEKMKADYITSNGFKASMEFIYSYESVEIVYNAE